MDREGGLLGLFRNKAVLACLTALCLACGGCASQPEDISPLDADGLIVLTIGTADTAGEIFSNDKQGFSSFYLLLKLKKTILRRDFGRPSWPRGLLLKSPFLPLRAYLRRKSLPPKRWSRRGFFCTNSHVFRISGRNLRSFLVRERLFLSDTRGKGRIPPREENARGLGPTPERRFLICNE